MIDCGSSFVGVSSDFVQRSRDSRVESAQQSAGRQGTAGAASGAAWRGGLRSHGAPTGQSVTELLIIT